MASFVEWFANELVEEELHGLPCCVRRKQRMLPAVLPPGRPAPRRYVWMDTRGYLRLDTLLNCTVLYCTVLILLHFTGPPVPITARVHSVHSVNTPECTVLYYYVMLGCVQEGTYAWILYCTVWYFLVGVPSEGSTSEVIDGHGV
eukprot:1065926-Prorocentrum_minimum.AAC.1